MIGRDDEGRLVAIFRNGLNPVPKLFEELDRSREHCSEHQIVAA